MVVETWFVCVPKWEWNPQHNLFVWIDMFDCDCSFFNHSGECNDVGNGRGGPRGPGSSWNHWFWHPNCKFRNIHVHAYITFYILDLPVVMFRLSPIIDCRSIIAKNSDYRSKISKIDHWKHIMYEMWNVESRMHSVRIGYYLQYGSTHRLE